MKSKKILRSLVIFVILISNVGCDQISKTLVRNHVEYYENISLIGNLFTLTKVENSGAFLSLGNDFPAPLKIVLLNVLPLLALLAGIIYLLLKNNLSKTMIAGLCFVIGGGIGNIYDRILYGSVTDFFHIDFIIFQTGIFNMADVSIMVGMGLILIQSFYKEEPGLAEEKKEQ